jgi:hypothetical protein
MTAGDFAVKSWATGDRARSNPRLPPRGWKFEKSAQVSYHSIPASGSRATQFTPRPGQAAGLPRADRSGFGTHALASLEHLGEAAEAMMRRLDALE